MTNRISCSIICKTEIMEIEKITSAFCPVCGKSILDRIRNLQEKTLRKQKEYYEGTKSLLKKPNSPIKLNEREQKEFDAYFAGTKISKKAVWCSHCHDDKPVMINDVTGAMTGFDLTSRLPQVTKQIVSPVVVIPPKAEPVTFSKEERKSSLLLIADEDFFLHVRHYPGIPSHC